MGKGETYSGLRSMGGNLSGAFATAPTSIVMGGKRKTLYKKRKHRKTKKVVRKSRKNKKGKTGRKQ